MTIAVNPVWAGDLVWVAGIIMIFIKQIIYVKSIN